MFFKYELCLPSIFNGYKKKRIGPVYSYCCSAIHIQQVLFIYILHWFFSNNIEYIYKCFIADYSKFYMNYKILFKYLNNPPINLLDEISFEYFKLNLESYEYCHTPNHFFLLNLFRLLLTNFELVDRECVLFMNGKLTISNTTIQSYCGW